MPVYFVALLLEHQIGDFNDLFFFPALFLSFTIDASDALFYQKVMLLIF